MSESFNFLNRGKFRRQAQVIDFPEKKKGGKPLEDEGYERPTLEEDATYLEQLFGASTLENVADGKTNPEAYEAFTMQKFEWTAEKIIWIDFLGLGHAEESKKPGTGLSFVPIFSHFIPH